MIFKVPGLYGSSIHMYQCKQCLTRLCCKFYSNPWWSGILDTNLCNKVCQSKHRKPKKWATQTLPKTGGKPRSLRRSSSIL